MVRMFPKLSRAELAKTICENLAWVTPTGQHKLDSCTKLLEKFEAQGFVSLPAKQENKIHDNRERISFRPRTEAGQLLEGHITDFEPIDLEPVRSQADIQLWNEYVHRYHTLCYKRPFGAHQRYFIISKDNREHPLGCLLFSAAAWALAVRDEWIGWSEIDRSLRLNLIVNNTRFLIFPWVRIKNLASKALSLAAKRIGYDWQERYGYRPVLLETFVDLEKYRATCYKAANWVLLGQTTGRGRMDRYKQYLSSPKLIYIYPLRRDFRVLLCGGMPDE
ncbi:MAG: hypothetical protein PWP04_1493 [Candidatus Atribacteria bacterium]|nr:hypothetical protein [Candidatus Atribacteria bacterium]